MARFGLLAAFGLAAAGAGAQERVTVDFRDGETNPFSAGTITGDIAHAGDHALRIGSGVNATLDIPEALRGQTVRVTMMVYDHGIWVEEGNHAGPRWGVSAGNGDDQAVSVGINHRSFLTSRTHYAVTSKNARFGSQHTMTAYRNRAAAAPMVNTPAEPGVWTRWTFTVTPQGVVTLRRDTQPALTPHGQAHHAESMGGPATQVFVAGGSGPLAGIVIDSVVIEPVEEPDTP